jgi:hypothetical protein
MPSLTLAQFSFLYRQEQLITFSLLNVFYGVCDCSLIHMRLMHLSSGVYATLVAFLVYFFCECLCYAHLIIVCQLSPLVTSEKKQTSYKALMGLIILMFAIQTIHIACNWYTIWLGFIYYSNVSDQALDALEVNPLTSLSFQVIGSIGDLLTTSRLAIADSIMVGAHL